MADHRTSFINLDHRHRPRLQKVFMIRTIVSLACLLIVAAVSAQSADRPAAASPIPIIFDTDMGADCDDVGALFILHGAIERGEITLLATIGCTSSEFIAPCIDAVNTWFGRPEIPVATLKDPGFMPNPGYSREISAGFPHRFPKSTDYPDAVTLYREVLAKQPDSSVIVVAVGPLRNLANLLKSRPDAASPLDGPALVAKKVKRLDIMGGKYPPDASRHAKDGEFNFMQDPAATALICSAWPTPVLFNGEGGSTLSGRRVTYEMPEHNPLTLAYMLSDSVGFAGDRSSWDPVSCLVAVRGAAPWYKIVSGGTNVADPVTGVNNWQAVGERNHSYLVRDQKRPKSEVEAALEDLMVAGKPQPSNLTFDTLTYANAGMGVITSAGERDKNGVWLDKKPSSWIQCQYVDGRKYVVNSYGVVCPDKLRLPRTLELSASNDGGVSWTVLDSQRSLVFPDKISRLDFTIAKPGTWNSYRLRVTAANESAGTLIAAVELNQAIQCDPKVAAASVTLDRQSLTIPVNGRAALNATIAPSNSGERQVAWRSSDPAVAEVRGIGEQIGMIVGKKPGTCTITAVVGKLTHVSTVTVTPSTLPADWNYQELNQPPIPGAVSVVDGKFTLTGSGHAMTSFWERVNDQGVFVSKPVLNEVDISARLIGLSPNVGGPKAYVNDRRPSTVSGLMMRESLTVPSSRYVLIQVDASGNLVGRWRDELGNGGKVKDLGKVTLPIHLKLVQSANEVNLFTSVDGQNWGKSLAVLPTTFKEKGHVGLFVCSGNPVSSTTAEFDSVTVKE